jgi:hypothetical protein
LSPSVTIRQHGLVLVAQDIQDRQHQAIVGFLFTVFLGAVQAIFDAA